MDPAHRLARVAGLIVALSAGACTRESAPAVPASQPAAAGAFAASGASAATPRDSLYDPVSGELRAPGAAAGVQLTNPAFEVAPGSEEFACYHTEIPFDGEVDVHYYESTLGAGSHHLILYKVDSDANVPLGTIDHYACVGDFRDQNWVYSATQPHVDLQIPDGVAIVMKPRQRVLLDMHYINTTDKPLSARVKVNVMFAQGTFQKAASIVSYNTGILIPPNGTQTVSSDCSPGPDAKYFYLLTHTHRRGTLATIHRVLADGQLGEQLVRTDDWEVPQD